MQINCLEQEVARAEHENFQFTNFQFSINLDLEIRILEFLALRMSESETPPFELWQILPSSDEYSERETVCWAVLLGRYPAKV